MCPGKPLLEYLLRFIFFVQELGKIQNLEHVKQLLNNADHAILPAIFELPFSSSIYFGIPQSAYDSIKQAREEYPDLPGFGLFSEFEIKPDNTGAHYTSSQKQLWEIRENLTELIAWCNDEELTLLDNEARINIELGAKIDEYNFERRRMLKR